MRYEKQNSAQHQSSNLFRPTNRSSPEPIVPKFYSLQIVYNYEIKFIHFYNSDWPFVKKQLPSEMADAKKKPAILGGLACSS